jgi:hypothetical protein
MRPAELDLEIFQGATFRKKFQYKTGAPALPVDLTGCKMRMQVREKIASPQPFITLTTENNGITIDDPAEGIFIVYMSATTTAALTQSRGVYDIELVYPNTDVSRLMYGAVTVSKEVTR